jgi:zinc protease
MLLDRSKAPEFRISDSFELTSPKEYTLANGSKLFFVPTPDLHAIKIEIIGKSQRLALPLERVLIPSFTIQLLMEGTKEYSEEKISTFFDYHASEVSPIIGYSQEGISLLTTKKHLFEVLEVFLTLFRDSLFPEDALSKRKSQRKLSLQLEKEKSASRANQLFRKALFGNEHPFGLEITEDHIDSIDREELVQYYQNLLWTEIEVFACGDLHEQELSHLISAFGALPNRTSPNIKLPIPVSIPKIHENRETALQSSIRVGGWSIPKSHPDFIPLSVFNTLLGGFFGSRLVKNIREDKGLTYGIHSSLAELGPYSYWSISADVKKTHKTETLFEIHKEISRLINEEIPSDELEVLRNYLVGQMLSQFSSPFDLIDRFRAVHHSGLDFSYFKNKMEFLKIFQSEDIQKVGARYFSDNPFIEIVVG